MRHGPSQASLSPEKRGPPLLLLSDPAANDALALLIAKLLRFGDEQLRISLANLLPPSAQKVSPRVDFLLHSSRREVEAILASYHKLVPDRRKKADKAQLRGLPPSLPSPAPV